MKMKKLFFAVMAVILFGITAGGCGAETNDPEVQNETSSQPGEEATAALTENLEDFKQMASNGKPCRVKIDAIWGDGVLAYDGEKYYAEGAGDGKYYEESDEERKYTYLLEERGTFPNAEKESYVVILADTEYDFKDMQFIIFGGYNDEEYGPYEDCKILIFE